MFTGLIERIGALRKRRLEGGAGRIEVSVAPWSEPFRIGESIAVDGVCLTVSNWDGSRLSFDVLDETFQKTTLGRMPIGEPVNLERALPTTGRLGGHILNGHVDGVGAVSSFRKRAGDWVLEVACEPTLLAGIVYKGCVAVNGVSLTVANLASESFQVHLIPETLKQTNLGEIKSERLVNLEIDVVGKYVRRYLESGAAVPSITWEQLRRQGLLDPG